MKLPARKMIQPSEVRAARFIKPVNIGRTRTGYYLDAISKELDVSLSKEFGYGKVYVVPSTTSSNRAKKVFLKPLVGPEASYQRLEGQTQVRTFDLLRNAGLPTIKAGVVEIGGQCYLAVEPFLRKGSNVSVLNPINSRSNSPRPLLLRQLNVRNDSELIRGLATDLATICNLGISTPYFDFHGFYKKKDGTLKRIIMDVNHFSTTPFNSTTANEIVKRIISVWGAKQYKSELDLFKNSLLDHINNPSMRGTFDKAFRKRNFWVRFLSSLEYQRRDP